MGKADFYAPGDWNIACSMCGRKRKASTLVKNWQGMWRCPEHNEPRHPQDFVKGVEEHMAADFVQNPTWTEVLSCDYEGASAIPARSMPGCCIPSLPYSE